MTDALLQDILTAEHGSRELDARIALEFGLYRIWISKHRYWNVEGPDGERFIYPQYGIPRFDPETGKKLDLEKMNPEWWWEASNLPYYTTNMQDALNAVPEGCYWFVDSRFDESPPQAGIKTLDGDDGFFAANAATPQLALCAAILQAKGAQDGQGRTSGLG